METKPERGKPRLKWKQCKTPEQKEAVRLYHKEYKKKVREKIRSVETPEEREARLEIARAKSRESRMKHRARELPEEREARRARVATNQRKRMDLKRAIISESEIREYNREHTKKFREKLYATETPEQREARLLKIREKAKEYRAKQKANETPEETAERNARLAEKRNTRMLLKQAIIISKEAEAQNSSENDKITDKRQRQIEFNRSYRLRKLATETPEETAARLEILKEKSKKYRIEKRDSETPEERIARRARAVEYRRNKAKQKLAAMVVLKTSDHKLTEDECKKIALNWEQWKTPEEREAALRQYQMENNKRHRSKKYTTETPGETAIRHQKWKEKSRAYREKRRAIETPEQKASRLAKDAEQQRLRSEARRLQKAKQIANGEVPVDRPENIDVSLNASNTWSSFGASEGGFSMTTTTTETSFCTSIKTEFLTDYSSSEEAPLVRNEASQDSWSYFEPSESTFASRDSLQDKNDPPDFGRDAFKFKDGDIDYSEYIAEKFRNCNRNNAEIVVAKNLIENILLNLSAGAYGSVKATEVSPSLQMTSPIMQAVIVKEEVDL